MSLNRYGRENTADNVCFCMRWHGRPGGDPSFWIWSPAASATAMWLQGLGLQGSQGCKPQELTLEVKAQAPNSIFVALGGRIPGDCRLYTFQVQGNHGDD